MKSRFIAVLVLFLVAPAHANWEELVLAVREGDFETARQILELDRLVGVDTVNVADSQRRRPIAFARDAEMANLLIIYGARLSDQERIRLIQLGVWQDNLPLVSHLLEIGVDVNVEDERGQRPIFFAASARMVRFLFSQGAMLVKSANGRRAEPASGLHVDSYGMNPLHHIFVNVVPMVFERALDVNIASHQIEQAVYSLLLANVQEIGGSYLREGMNLERQMDGARNYPYDYLDGSWSLEFRERLKMQHIRNYHCVEPRDPIERLIVRQNELLEQRQLERARESWLKERYLDQVTDDSDSECDFRIELTDSGS